LSALAERGILGRVSEIGTIFSEVFAASGWALDNRQAELAVGHAELLVRWNESANLTRIVEPVEMARRHFLESFEASRLFGPGALSVLDVGAGGGFPGLAARIVRPHLDLTVLEPRERKCAFLRAVARLDPTSHVRVVASRLEDFRPDAAFDVVTYRAVKLPARDIVRVLAPAGRVVTFETSEGEPPAPELELEGRRDVANGFVAAWTRKNPGR
jgi:16S rRNA (guanine527-N7)-methyltransferase